MQTLIKENDEKVKQKIETLGVDWLSNQGQKIKTNRRRIIKASVLPQNKKAKREIPISKTICEQPEIKVIGTEEQIEGIEIVCNCGQKMTVHFNYDKNNAQSE